MPRPLTIDPLPSSSRKLALAAGVREKLDAFIAENPFLVEQVRQMPREILEQRYLLNQMASQEVKASYQAKVMAWLSEEPGLKAAFSKITCEKQSANVTDSLPLIRSGARL